jgi:hypothetical protein
VSSILPPATALSVENSGTFDLNGASQTVASVAVASGAAVNLDGGSLTIAGNAGNAIVQGAITGSGTLANNGTLRLVGNAALNFTGTFVNTGVLDIMTWNGTLPAGFVNQGIVLDRSAVKIDSTAKSDNSLTLTITGYAGHNYQLQRVDDLSGTWENIGTAQAGNDAPLTFTDPAGAAGKCRFYRIILQP